MKKISIEELLIWFKHYERYMEGDPIDAVEWRGEFLEFVMYLINNLLEDEKEEESEHVKLHKEVFCQKPSDLGVCKYCGGSDVVVKGKGMTHYYYCMECHQPTDLVSKSI